MLVPISMGTNMENHENQQDNKNEKKNKKQNKSKQENAILLYFEKSFE